MYNWQNKTNVRKEHSEHQAEKSITPPEKPFEEHISIELFILFFLGELK